MPGTVPAISPAPGRAGVWFAFGHGMLGLTQGAVTGELVADRTPRYDIAPFSPQRFR